MFFVTLIEPGKITMKISRIHWVGVLACLTLLVIGCTKEPVAPNNPAASNRLTLNGGGHANEKLTFPDAVASYLTESDVTVVAIGDSTVPETADAPGALIFFKGNTVGTFTINNADSNVFVWVFTDTTQYALISGTVTITKYGAVGEKIEGTFAGSGTTNVNGVDIPITVTDGAFSAVRLLDNKLDPDVLDPTIDFSLVIDGEVFDQQLFELKGVDVVVDSAFFSGGAVYRKMEATGITILNEKLWIVNIVLQPKQGPWSTGTFSWRTPSPDGFASAIFTFTPENPDDAIVLVCDGKGGSTIITDIEGNTVSGVFSGSTLAGPSNTYQISNGRFKFDLPE